MIISVASGKGGTGKTTVAVNLALSLSLSNHPVQLLDCDVEEPNAHLFLSPVIAEIKQVQTPVPVVDGKLCDSCGKCAAACAYNALAVLPRKGVLIFPELCHGCGLCTLICPQRAITEAPRAIGLVKKGKSADGAVELVYGELNIGEVRAAPVVDAVKAELNRAKTAIIDVPPGTACPVIAAVQGSDYGILVTEPTPFGLYDLKLAVALLRLLRIPVGVVVNRAGIGDRGVYEYCKQENIPILLEIPHDRRIARCYSEGVPFVQAMPDRRARFVALAARIEELLQ